MAPRMSICRNCKHTEASKANMRYSGAAVLTLPLPTEHCLPCTVPVACGSTSKGSSIDVTQAKRSAHESPSFLSQQGQGRRASPWHSGHSPIQLCPPPALRGTCNTARAFVHKKIASGQKANMFAQPTCWALLRPTKMVKVLSIGNCKVEMMLAKCFAAMVMCVARTKQIFAKHSSNNRRWC